MKVRDFEIWGGRTLSEAELRYISNFVDDRTAAAIDGFLAGLSFAKIGAMIGLRAGARHVLRKHVYVGMKRAFFLTQAIMFQGDPFEVRDIFKPQIDRINRVKTLKGTLSETESLALEIRREIKRLESKKKKR